MLHINSACFIAKPGEDTVRGGRGRYCNRGGGGSVGDTVIGVWRGGSGSKYPLYGCLGLGHQCLLSTLFRLKSSHSGYILQTGTITENLQCVVMLA